KVANVIDNGVDLSTPRPEPATTGKGSKAKTPAPLPTPTKSRGKTATGFFDEYEDAVKQSGAQYEKAQPGKKIDLGGGAILTVLAPAEPFFNKDQMKAGGNETNANSIVLRLDYGEFSMLLMGDADAHAEDRPPGKDV